jgi:hypothetical protein
MLHVSEDLRKSAAKPSTEQRRAKVDAAWTHVLRAQCNDVYWHGIFGGLYAPHLRSALWSELVRAEILLADISSTSESSLCVERSDFDADGLDEIYVTSRRMGVLLRPADGGTISILDSRGAGITLINSIQRRPEAYHSQLRNASAAAASHVVSIHEGGRALEQGLERYLRYDRWARNAFRLYAFPRERNFEDYRNLRMGEHNRLAGGRYAISEAGEAGVVLSLDNTNSSEPSCTKKFTFAPQGDGYRVTCDVELAASDGNFSPMKVGLEMVLNLLAPDALDRYFEIGEA